MINRVMRWNRLVLFEIVIAAFVLAAPQAQAQAPGPDRVSISLTDSSRPSTIKVGLNNGTITVKGYDGKEIIAEAKTRSGGDGSGSEGPDGLKRIPLAMTTGLSAEEENNKVDIGVTTYRNTDLIITAPYKTSLILQASSMITISDIEGDLEVNNNAGGITLNHISGSVTASTQGGAIKAMFVRVDPQKPMAFSNYYGSIDVTFPANLKANLTLNSDNGNIFSDFDFQVSQTPQQVIEDARKEGGAYRVKVERKVHGTINGGGPEIQFSNLQGNIYIRKAKQ